MVVLELLMVSSLKAQMDLLSSLMMVSAHLLVKPLLLAPLVTFVPEMVLLEEDLLEEEVVVDSVLLELASDKEMLPSLLKMLLVVVSFLDKTLVVTVLFLLVLPLVHPVLSLVHPPFLPQSLILSSPAHSSTVKANGADMMPSLDSLPLALKAFHASTLSALTLT